MRRASVGLFLIACGASTPPPQVAHGPVEMSDWKTLSFGSVLIPKTNAIAQDGSFTLVWHFHACRAADADYRSLEAPVVVMCINNLGLGTAPYTDAFTDHERFAKLEQEVLATVVKDQVRPDAHVGRTILVAWSAGYASIQQILSVHKYYEQTSAVVLLDGLHTGYTKNADGSSTKIPNIETSRALLRFADDASVGKKVFVFTHSGVVPPDYASTTEMAHALESRLKMGVFPSDVTFPGAIDVADGGNVHIRGWTGGEAKDHIAQLHWVAPVLNRWVLR